MARGIRGRRNRENGNRYTEILKKIKNEVFFVYLPVGVVFSEEEIASGYGNRRRVGEEPRMDAPYLVGRTLEDISKLVIDGTPVSIQNGDDIPIIYNLLKEYLSYKSHMVMVANQGEDDVQLDDAVEVFAQAIVENQTDRIYGKARNSINKMRKAFSTVRYLTDDEKKSKKSIKTVKIKVL